MKGGDEKAKEEKEKEALEKSVSIRFANYSLLVKQNEYSHLFGSQLMALIGGFMPSSSEMGSGLKAKLKMEEDGLVDRSEEDLLRKVEGGGKENWRT